MTVNLATSVVTASLYIKLMPYIEDNSDVMSMPSDVQLLFFVLCLWILFLGAVALTGLVLLFVFNKKFKPYKTPDEPSVGMIIGNCLKSPLFWSYIVIELGQFGSAYLPDIVNYFI